MDNFKFDEERLQDFFEGVTGNSLTLTITDNSSTMISFKKKGENVSLRLHKMFHYAGAEVLHEVAQFIVDKEKKTPLINKFISENKDRIKDPPVKKTPIVSQGRYYDLQKIFDYLNRQYFDNRIKASITWGKRRNSSATRIITLGTYNVKKNMIRITPLLDRSGVPQFFVEFIVYHEMLHADMGIAVKGGRRVIHSPEFKYRERLFRHYYEALLWEKKNISLL